MWAVLRHAPPLAPAVHGETVLVLPVFSRQPMAAVQDAIDVVMHYAGTLPTPHCEIFLGLLGGHAATFAPDDTAYPHRDALYVMNVHTRWDDPARTTVRAVPMPTASTTSAWRSSRPDTPRTTCCAAI